MLKLILRALWPQKHRRTIIFLIIGNVIFTGLILLEPVFFREIINTLTSFEETTKSDSISRLNQFLLLWIGVGILFLSIRATVSLKVDRFSHIAHLEDKQSYFAHVLQLSMRFHGSTHSGKTLKKFNRGTDAIFWLRLDFYRNILPDVFTVLFLIPLIIFLNWRLAGTLILFVVLFLLVAFPVIRVTNKRQKKVEDLYSKESALAGDVFSNISVVKSFARIQVELQNLSEVHRDIKRLQFPILNWWAFLAVLSRISSTLIFLAVFFVGSHLYFMKLATIGDIVMFVGFSAMLLGSLEGILWQVNSVFWRLQGIREFYEVIDNKIEVQDHPDAIPMPRAKGMVEFKQVNFWYEDGRQALKDINITAKPGEVIALVGQTGAGKSTISNLLSRFYETQEGSISIDGYQIDLVTQDSLRQNIGVVFQENYLFHATVKENIQIGNPDATAAQVREAAKKAHAWEFISALPKGLDTVVGERGVKLSGGEKQRIAIARVILKNPSILILDEATSALDSVTEQNLQQALESVIKGRTTFIIAHRLSTIRKADRILVIEHGKIVESGTYTELKQKNGIFSRLTEAQAAGFIDL